MNTLHSVVQCNFRFSCVRQNDVLLLRGIISADVEYSRFKDVFVGAVRFDFSDVKFASWNGLLKMFTFMEQCGMKGIFGENIRWDVLAPICFLDARFHIITPTLFEVKYSFTGNAVLEMTELETLRKMVSANLMIEKKENALAENFLMLLLKNYLSDPANHQPEQIGLNQEKSMLTAVASFQKSIFEVCYSQIFAIGVSVSSVVREICARRDTICSALGSIGLEIPKALGDLSWDSLSSRLDHCFVTLLVQLEQLSQDMGAMLEKLKFIWLESPNSLVDQKSLIARLEQIKGKILSFDSVCDEMGVCVFVLLQEAGIAEHLTRVLVEIEKLGPDADALAKIAEGFSVMDPFAAESWETLKPEIIAEITFVENSFMSTIMESQGFDAVKQVVQKRAKELEVWQEYGGFNNYNSSSQDEFEKGKLLLLEELTRKLVTEQERLAYEIFFGHIKARTAATVDTSDVSFF